MKLTNDELICLAKDGSISWIEDFGEVKGGCKFTWPGYLELARTIESFTEQRLSEPKEAVRCNLQEVEAVDSRLFVELARKVIMYYQGEGEYNFSHLSRYDRDNAAFDAWQEIRQEIKEALRDYDSQKAKSSTEKPLTAAWRLGLSAALEALAVNTDWEAEDPKFLILRVAEQIRKNGH